MPPASSSSSQTSTAVVVVVVVAVAVAVVAVVVGQPHTHTHTYARYESPAHGRTASQCLSVRKGVRQLNGKHTARLSLSLARTVLSESAEGLFVPSACECEACLSLKVRESVRELLVVCLVAPSDNAAAFRT